jgi:hypothetical protein
MENVLISPPHRALYRALSMTASTKRSINDLFPKLVRDKQKSELGKGALACAPVAEAAIWAVERRLAVPARFR